MATQIAIPYAERAAQEKILVVQNEARLLLTLAHRLRSEGYAAVTAQDGEEGLTRASSEFFKLIILDLILPKKGGLDVCRDLCQQGVKTPILMLTVRRQTTDKVDAFKLGADDYLTKPFNMAELMARVEALLRRFPAEGASPGALYEFGSVHVDFRRAEVLREGIPVSLTPREFQLRKYFVEHRGAMLSRKELLRDVWGCRGALASRTVDAHIVGLRHKLENDPKHPRHFLTRQGLGYKFAA